MQGKTLVFEGIDGSGKKTQVERTARWLIGQNYSVKMVSFPRHSSDEALLVDKYLRGELGLLPVELVATMYAVDRGLWVVQEKIQEHLASSGIVVIDRGAWSNFAYQAGTIASADSRKELFAWLLDMEHAKFHFPVADLNFFLDVPPKNADMLVNDKPAREYLNGKDRDELEADPNRINIARDIYLELAKRADFCHIICCAPNGDLLPPEEIFTQLILPEIQRVL